MWPHQLMCPHCHETMMTTDLVMIPTDKNSKAPCNDYQAGPMCTGGELRSGVKCIVVTFVTGLF